MIDRNGRSTENKQKSLLGTGLERTLKIAASSDASNECTEKGFIVLKVYYILWLLTDISSSLMENFWLL